MRAKLLLLGAAAAVALSSTAALASVVVVRSLGPSAKAYPPGKTLPESASISLKGGDVVIVQALKALKAAGLLKSMNVIVVMTGDEEDAGLPLTKARQALVDAAKGADSTSAVDIESLQLSSHG